MRYWKLTAALCLIVIILGVAAMVANRTEASKGSSLPKPPIDQSAFQKLNHEFGMIKNGDTVRHTFELKNGGAAPIDISQVKLSCGGCLSAGQKPFTLAPGQTRPFEVTYNSRGKRGRDEQHVILLDEAMPRFQLTLRGSVAAVWLDRTYIDLGVVHEGQKNIHDGIYVLAAGYPDANVAGLPELGPGATLRLEEATVDKPSQAAGIRSLGYLCIDIDLSKRRGTGRFSQTFSVPLAGQGVPQLNATLEYYVLGSAIVIPPVLNFGVVAPGKTASAQTRISWLAPVSDSQALTISGGHPFVTGQLHLDASGQSILKADLSHTSGTASQLIEGDLTVTLGSERIVSIPYTAFLK